MIRLNLMLTLAIYTILSTSVVFAQQGGTVRGQITGTTENQTPIEDVTVEIIAQDGTEYTTITDANGDYKHTDIPAGRYLILIYKDGYEDRFGKPVTVVNGGDHFLPLKITKRDNILIMIFKSFGSLSWILFFCCITVLVTFLFTKRRTAER